MISFDLKYIIAEGLIYTEAVAIREELFFKNMSNSLDLINDDFESNATHLVCLNKGEVIGTVRLNIVNRISIISQMAIKTAYQKRGVGAKLLNELIRYSKAKKLSKIKLSARETAILFYEKFNFVPTGNKYPSEKTKIIHQQMEFIID